MHVEATRITDTPILCFRPTKNDSDFLTMESDMYLVGDESWYRISSCSDRCIRDSTLYDARSTCQARGCSRQVRVLRQRVLTRPNVTPGWPAHWRPVVMRIYRDAHPSSTIAFANVRIASTILPNTETRKTKTWRITRNRTKREMKRRQGRTDSDLSCTHRALYAGGRGGWPRG